jgi:outer membrane protein assembly factor BamB
MKKIASVMIIMLLITPMLALSSMAQRPETTNEEIDLPDSQWTMFRHNIKNTGQSNSQTPASNNLLWQHEAPSNYGTDNPSVIAGGKMYIGALEHIPHGGRGVLLCLDAFTGEKIFKYPVDGNIRSSPAVDQGKVFFNVDNKWLYALDAVNGSLIWKNYLSDEKGFLTQSSPIVYNEKVYIGVDADAGEPGIVYCFDANTGRTHWLFQTSYGVTSTPAIDQGHLYVGTMDDYSFFGSDTAGTMYCINAVTGELKWSRLISKEFPLQLTSSPAVYNGKLYVNAGLMRLFVNIGFTYCLDAKTGEILWSKPLNRNLYTSPAVAYERVFVNAGPYFVCLDANDGRQLWRFDVPYGFSQSSPAVASGQVFYAHTAAVPNMPRRAALSCLDAFTGEMVWSYKVNQKNPYVVYTSPSIAQGIVYFGSQLSSTGTIYAIGDLAN